MLLDEGTLICDKVFIINYVSLLWLLQGWGC